MLKLLINSNEYQLNTVGATVSRHAQLISKIFQADLSSRNCIASRFYHGILKSLLKKITNKYFNFIPVASIGREEMADVEASYWTQTNPMAKAAERLQKQSATSSRRS